MKKFLAVAAFASVLAFSSQTIFARGMGPGGGGNGFGGGPGYGPGMMFEELDLTDDQVDKIYKINMEYREKAWKDRIEHRKAIDKILTADQKKKLEDARKNRFNDGKKGDRKKKGKKDRRNDRRGMGMGPALDLSDDQLEKIHKINMEYADKFHKNRKNSDELKKLRESRIKDIEKVLTKEQLDQVNKFRKNNKGNRDCPYFPEY